MAEFVHHPPHGVDWSFDPTLTYDDSRPALGGMKPRGLWLSVDDDWRRWCEGEDWNTPLTEPIRFEVDTDRCLWLKTAEEIDRFHDEYKTEDDHYIDWTRLAKQYAGIIIAPYQWSRRLSFGEGTPQWYYGWDCASACVWDLSALSVIERVDA